MKYIHTYQIAVKLGSSLYQSINFICSTKYNKQHAQQ